ncbi:O-antigen ligase family protein [Streptomyces sp. NPDC046805]|uniref:O-antigen ligase family protein n=1 Tax=Streptomyces sp. NPDC046805 TaxID=3155134 RepID=UPI003403948C
MASVAEADSVSDRGNVSDVVGMAVLGACAAWALITAAAHDGRPEGVLLAVLAVTAGYAWGRITGTLLPVAAPCAGALTGLGLAVSLPQFAPGPQFTTPLGDVGATAALLTLATGAACCAAWAATAPAVRVALRALAAGIVATAAAMGSTAGCALGATVLLCSLAAGRMRRRGPGIVSLALATVLVAGACWVIAAHALPDGLALPLEDRLTPRRVQLWHDALHSVAAAPELGVGPGRFGELGSAAPQALLHDGKPHSAPLQQAAEQGLIGLVLLAGAYCWVLYALWRTPRPTPIALTTGAALTALAAIATVGNALSFTTVSVGAGVLAGLATARPLTGDLPER